MKTKNWLFACWLLIIASAIAYLFWHSEWKYSLPTPIPENYHAVNTGTRVLIKDIPGLEQNSKPLFLHFFNPDCPCSRFNITHFKSLVKKYGSRVNFAVVALAPKERYTDEAIKRKFGLSIPVVFDSSYAAQCGVYSTPQAALINTDHCLFFRGNYNKSRYCTDKNSNYAQMAIDALLAQQKQPDFGLAATKSYGCTLPTCTR
jgi:hypothetical protein